MRTAPRLVVECRGHQSQFLLLCLQAKFKSKIYCAGSFKVKLGFKSNSSSLFETEIVWRALSLGWKNSCDELPLSNIIEYGEGRKEKFGSNDKLPRS